MSQFEEAFMAGFNDALGAEKTAEEEMPILDKALTNLGLLEEETEEVEMPILKKAMENLGLTEEEEGEEEPASLLEELAIKYGPAVAEEREALEKEASRTSMVREKARSIYKTMGRATGARDISKGVAGLLKARRMKKDVNEPHAKKQLGKRKTKAAVRLGRGAAKAGLTAGITGIGARMAAGAISGKKKDKGKKGKK